MRYVEARFEDYQREETYRIYVTKSLQLAPQNGYMENSYFDIIFDNIEPELSGEEIIADVMLRAELSFGD